MKDEISQNATEIKVSSKPKEMVRKTVTVKKTVTAKKRTVNKKDKTTILNTKELKGLLTDVVDPVRIAESITGVNVVDELVDNKKSIV